MFALCSSKSQNNAETKYLSTLWDSTYKSGLSVVDAILVDPPAFREVMHMSASGELASRAERCYWRQLADIAKAYPKAEWYLLGDDDSVFLPAALQAELCRYDHTKPIYMEVVANALARPVKGKNAQLNLGRQLQPSVLNGDMAVSQALMQIIIREWETCLQQSQEHAWHSLAQPSSSCDWVVFPLFSSRLSPLFY